LYHASSPSSWKTKPVSGFRLTSIGPPDSQYFVDDPPSFAVGNPQDPSDSIGGHEAGQEPASTLKEQLQEISLQETSF